MDPLHPLLPIQPPPPAPPPGFSRVERIDRDGQREDHPEWGRESDKEPDQQEPEQPQDQLEDDYDPDWTDPAAVEPYGPDGAHHDAISIDLSAEKKWDPRIHPDRRTRPRDQDDDVDPETGHIDIGA